MKPITARLALTLVMWLASRGGLAQEAFQVNLADDGDTIGEMRPVFLKFTAQAMPAISPREVARRYQRLFDQSAEPEVRIDALNRLSHLQSVSGERLDLSPEQEQRLYRNAIDSYQMIVNSGSFRGRLDELLYQSAKAYAYIGQNADSIERLEQLVGLYPSSALAPEARFRIAESAFSEGHFADAEAAYRQVLAGQASVTLTSKARYMLGWSLYKQYATAQAGERFIDVLDEYAEQSNNFQRVSPGAAEVVNDTFRIIAMMTANAGGADALEALLAHTGARPYDYLLYDRLADYYAARHQYRDSVAVSRAFLSISPYHPSAPGIRAQIVDVWAMADEPVQSRQAMAAYVLAYQPDLRYAVLPAAEQVRWSTYTRSLADHDYHTASNSGNAAAASQQFGQAADYYKALADKNSQPGPLHRLAADAWLQADILTSALTAYEQAGYDDPRFAGAADAAWAGLKLRIQQLEQADGVEPALTQLATTANRFAKAFPEDSRLPALQADLGNRLLAAGEQERAAQFAGLAVVNPQARPEDAYSGWLVLGATRMDASDYRSAEQAWREALGLADRGVRTARDELDQAALRQQLATSIYRQAEQAAAIGETDQAVANYQRIETAYPGSAIAMKGRYDAAASLLKTNRWQAAINELQRFRNDYPEQELTRGVSEKLVQAYQSSGQPVRAADELMASLDATGGERSAIWPKQLRAADLYDQAGETVRRNTIYQQYLSQASTPDDVDEHLRQQRMRSRLIASDDSPEPYRNKLRRQLVDQELASNWHSEASLASAARSAITLGNDAAEVFQGIALTLPLNESLDRKQKTLAEARKRYQQAQALGDADIRSESLFRRATLYQQLAKDIIGSARPTGLSDLEGSQYTLLLEEQAYPFEDKAIELHAENHQQLAVGIYNVWIKQSLDALGQLFPGRYARSNRWIAWSEEAEDGR